MKRFVPILIALAIFAVAFVMMQPEETVTVLTAARDLPAGHQIVAADLDPRAFPQSLVPAEAITDPQQLVGKTLRVARSPGDAFYPSVLGGEVLELGSKERAVAIRVSDSAGLAGLLKPGDRVGVTAVISSNNGAFSKVVAAGLRVLYLSPAFKADDPAPPQEESTSPFRNPGSSNGNREDTGTVVLAVSTETEVVAYDFAAFGVESETRTLNVVDLLPALDHASNVALSLFLEPEAAQPFISSGLYLPDLVITPGPSPTPTETPFGSFPLETPSP